MKGRYTCIVKTGDRFLKYRNVGNLQRFTVFLDTRHTGWRYYNVFDKETRRQVASYTVNSRPSSKHVVY